MLDTIPNNVDLDQNPKLQRALLHWHPKFIEWWKEMGPEGFQQDRIYLRTAVGVSAGDWAIRTGPIQVHLASSVPAGSVARGRVECLCDP